MTEKLRFPNMQNVTVSIEETALEWANFEAKKLGLSVSLLLGKLLKDEMLKANAYELAMQGWNTSQGVALTTYSDLNPRQQENYNFHKVSAILADFGFTCIRLSDDWNGADFIALHKNGETDLKVQLKGVYSLDKKYLEKNIWICFRHARTGAWYLYPHDEAVQWAKDNTNLENTDSWTNEKKGFWTSPNLSKRLVVWLRPYAIPSK